MKAFKLLRSLYNERPTEDGERRYEQDMSSFVCMIFDKAGKPQSGKLGYPEICKEIFAKPLFVEYFQIGKEKQISLEQ